MTEVTSLISVKLAEKLKLNGPIVDHVYKKKITDFFFLDPVQWCFKPFSSCLSRLFLFCFSCQSKRTLSLAWGHDGKGNMHLDHLAKTTPGPSQASLQSPGPCMSIDYNQ